MKLKKVAAFLLVMIIIAASMVGCNMGEANNTNDESQQNQAMGRFIESEMKLPGEIDVILAAGKLADGTLQVVGKNEMEQVYIVRSRNQGDSWEKVSVNNLNQMFISGAAIAPDGTAALFGYFEDSADSNKMDIKLANKDGVAEAVNLTMPELTGESYSNIIWQAAYDADGNLLIRDSTGMVYRVDTESGSCTALLNTGNTEMDYFGIAGDTLLAVTVGSEIQLFSTADGRPQKRDAVLDELGVTNTNRSNLNEIGYCPMVFAAGHEEGSYIYANHEGVFYHGAGGSVSEQLTSKELTSLGDSSIMLGSIAQLDELTYVLLILDAVGDTRLLKYKYDENESAVPEKILRVYALEDSAVLQQAIAYYQKEYPDIFVSKEIGLGGGGINAEDALRALSTDILAGEGPDILILDGMPIESYIEKGILADISSVVNEIDSTDGIFSNIKNIYQQEDKIYHFPARFYLSVISGSEEAVAAGGSIEDLLAYAKEATQADSEKWILPAAGAKGILQELMNVESANWQKEDGSVDQAKLETFLNCAKEMFQLVKDNPMTYSEAYEESEWMGVDGRDGMIVHSYPTRLMNFHEVAFGTMGSMVVYSDLVAAEKEMQGTFDLFDRQNSKTIIPNLLVGVAENSNEKENAMNFIRTMLGKESESVDGGGFPINRVAFEIQYESIFQHSKGMQLSIDEELLGEYHFMVFKPTEEEYNELLQMVESLDAPAVTDRIVKDLVISEGIEYLNDEQSLEITVTAIMQKINLYLSE